MQRSLAEKIVARPREKREALVSPRHASIASQLATRKQAATAATGAAKIIAAVMGRDFPFVPRFRPRPCCRAEYGARDLGHSSVLPPPTNGAGSPRQNRCVRPFARERKLELYTAQPRHWTGCLRSGVNFLTQIPARWIALPFEQGRRPPALRPCFSRAVPASHTGDDRSLGAACSSMNGPETISAKGGDDGRELPL